MLWCGWVLPLFGPRPNRTLGVPPSQVARVNAIIEGDEDKNFPAEEVYARAEDVLVARCARERVHAREKRESQQERESLSSN